MCGAGGTWHRVVLYLRDSIPVIELVGYGMRCYGHLLVATGFFFSKVVSLMDALFYTSVVQPPLSCGPTFLYSQLITTIGIDTRCLFTCDTQVCNCNSTSFAVNPALNAYAYVGFGISVC